MAESALPRSHPPQAASFRKWWAASNRNGGRDHSLRRATSYRYAWATSSECATELATTFKKIFVLRRARPGGALYAGSPASSAKRGGPARAPWRLSFSNDPSDDSNDVPETKARRRSHRVGRLHARDRLPPTSTIDGRSSGYEREVQSPAAIAAMMLGNHGTSDDCRPGAFIRRSSGAGRDYAAPLQLNGNG